MLVCSIVPAHTLEGPGTAGEGRIAMMTALRNNTKPIIWFTAVAFVVGFILILGTDVFFGSSASPELTAARVNGETITAQQWDQALQEAYNSYRAQAGENPDPATDIRLRAQAWQSLIQQVLVTQEAKRMGIQITDEELAFAIRNQPLPQFVRDPSLQTQGRFDLAKYQQLLAHPNFPRRTIEAMYRKSLPLELAQQRVLLAACVGEEEIWETYRRQNEQIKMELAYIPTGLVAVPDDEQNPDDAELQSFMKENRDKFRSQEQADLRYVRIVKAYSDEDSLEALDIIQNALEEYRDGETFDVLVDAYSEASPSRRGGEQGILMRREQFTQPQIRDSVFAMEPDEVSGIISTGDGFHIIKLEQKTVEDDVEKVKIAEIFVPLRISYDTRVAIRDSVLAFADSSKIHGFDAAARDFGFVPDSTGLFARDGFPRGLGPLKEAIDFAFEGAQGDISRPMETADAWFVLQIKQRLPARDPELSEIRDRVKLEWIQEKRRGLGERKAKALLKEVLAGRTIEEVAGADSVARYQVVGPINRSGFVPGVGSSPELLGAAFASDTTDAPRAVHTDRGSFIIKILEKVPASRDDFEGQKDQLGARILQQRQNEVLNSWIEQLEKDAEIEDFRRTLVSL